MAGDPTRTQPQTRQSESPAFQEWYVVITGGASALRITPGLTVGESGAGILALNDPDVGNQWIEFVLADNGEPWATIVTRDKSLRVGGTTCLRHPLAVGATVRLPNNTLHISRDIRMPRLSETVIEVVHRDIPERPQFLAAPAWEEARAAVREPRAGTPAAEIPEPSEPVWRQADASPDPDRDDRDDWSDPTPTMAEPRRRTWRRRSAGRRRQVAVLAGVLGLGAVTLAGVVAVVVSMGKAETTRLASFDPLPVDTRPLGSPPPAPAESVGGVLAPVSGPAPVPAEVADGSDAPGPQTAAGSRPQTAAGTWPQEAAGTAPREVAGTAGSRSPPAAAGLPESEPAAAAAREPEQVAMLSRTAPELPAPVVQQPVERRAEPPAEQTSEPTSGGADAVTDAEPIDAPPDAALVAELEEIGETAQALAEELARRRDLRAADLALAQGRLTSPPEASAYTLYNRVLAADPGSPEAVRGLEAVRQGLINRALAQLAGDALDDARRTLQVAADAGADPLLIADLSAEIDYRRQVIDAR